MERLKHHAHTALRKSEKYFKTDMVYLTKGGFWLMFGHIIQMASGLALAIMLSNLLPKEAYGKYQFIISASAIIAGITLSGMGTALTRAVARGATGTLSYAFKTQLLWSIGIIVTSGLISLYYFLNGNNELATAFLIVGICTPFLSGFSLYRPYLEGRGFFRESTTLGIWRRPLPVIAVFISLLFTDNPVIIIGTYFLSQTISMGLLYLLVIEKYPEPQQSNPELLNYSKHLSVMGVVSLVANNIDKILVFHFLGAAPAAAYTLAQLPSTQILKMFSLLGKIIFPKFAQRELNILKKTLLRKILIFFTATIFVAILYIVAAPYIFKFIFPMYPEAVLLSQVLILTILAKPLMFYTQAFAAHGLKRPQYISQITVSVLKISLLLILVPLYGLWGAVWAILIATLYWGTIVTILFYRTKA